MVMSTFLVPIVRFAIWAVILGLVPVIVTAQELSLRVRTGDTPFLAVEGKFRGPFRPGDGSLKFLDTYADVNNISSRIRNIRFSDASGRSIEFKRFGGTAIVIPDTAFTSFSYEVDLSIPENGTSAAHTSWVGKAHGLLMLGDLIPRFAGPSEPNRIRLVVPDGWTVVTTEERLSNREFKVSDIEKAVFFVGKGWRGGGAGGKNGAPKFAIAGRWQFGDEDVIRFSNEILTEYKRLLGEPSDPEIRIFLLPFPRQLGFDRWRAETRGSSITILSSPTGFQSRATQRLHEQLRHELLHLWIPNGLNLDGDYAWFYEGFSMYQALKTGVWLGQIRFEDFLDTMTRAYDLENRREAKISLTGNSPSRWGNLGSSVYARGMIVAFLCDITMLRESRGRKDISYLFRRLLEIHGQDAVRIEANRAILRVLNDQPELKAIVRGYIEGVSTINWTNQLASAGIQATGAGLKVRPKPGRRQRALLSNLGYNRWRKILRNTR